MSTGFSCPVCVGRMPAKPSRRGGSLAAACVLRLALCAFALSLHACAPARQPIAPGVVPSSKPPTVDEEQYGHQVLEGLTRRWQLDYSHPKANNVSEVVNRLAAAAKADQEPWHVYVFKDDNFKNAAATRGNHVFIWTGMLNAAQNDEELAAVIAHEMAHVLARHTDPDPNEELRKMLIQVGAAAAGMAAAYATRGGMYSRTVGDLTSSVAKEVTSGFLVNPYTREKELEADQVGLFLMADAKYDPDAAIRFWSRAKADPAFSSTLAFLSTHPPAEDRLEQLQRLREQAHARFTGIAAPIVERGPINTDKSLPERRAQLDPDRRLPADDRTHSDAGAPRAQRQPEQSTPGSPSYDPGSDTFDMRNAPPPPPDAPAPRTPERTDVPPQVYPAPGGQPADSLPAPPQPADQRGEDWTIIVPKAVLYSEPSRTSKPLGEFQQGAVVRVVSEQDDWLEIDRPDQGFLPRFQLIPDDPHGLD